MVPKLFFDIILLCQLWISSLLKKTIIHYHSYYVPEYQKSFCSKEAALQSYIDFFPFSDDVIR